MSTQILFSITFSSIKETLSQQNPILSTLEYDAASTATNVQHILKENSLIATGTPNYSIKDGMLNVQGFAHTVNSANPDVLFFDITG